MNGRELERTHGDGRVFARTYRHDDGTSSTVWHIAYYVGGRQFRESSKSSRESVAVRLLGRRLDEHRRGEYLGPKVDKTTYLDLEALLRNEYTVKRHRSLANAEFRLVYLQRFFGRHRVASITQGLLLQYVVERRADGAADATIAMELRLLRRAFTLGRGERKVRDIPAFPTVQGKVRKGFCSVEQIESVIDHLPDHLKPVVRTLYTTGWRKNEVLGLTWDRVSFEDGVIRLDAEDTKTGEARAFPFDVVPDLTDLLRERHALMKAAQAEARIIPWVFWRGKRRARPIGSFRKAWADATKDAGVPGLLVHDLRRSAARNLVRFGASQAVAMVALGHKTPSIFARYNITSSKDLRDGLAGYGARLAQARNPRETRAIGKGEQPGRLTGRRKVATVGKLREAGE